MYLRFIQFLTLLNSSHSYNQEAANCMFALVAAGKDDAALQVRRPLSGYVDVGEMGFILCELHRVYRYHQMGGQLTPVPKIR